MDLNNCKHNITKYKLNNRNVLFYINILEYLKLKHHWCRSDCKQWKSISVSCYYQTNSSVYVRTIKVG